MKDFIFIDVNTSLEIFPTILVITGRRIENSSLLEIVSRNVRFYFSNINFLSKVKGLFQFESTYTAF